MNDYIQNLKTLKDKNVVPKSFSNDMECILYIMHFIHPHLDRRFSYYEPWDIFVTFYDLPLRAKQLICHEIKKEVNDGNIIEILNKLEKMFK